MAVLEKYLDADSDLGVHPERRGPVRALDFETWDQEDENPCELLGGWVVPMSPGTYRVGLTLTDLMVLFHPLTRTRGWLLLPDARHRLPQPKDSVVFPDLAIHCVPAILPLAGTETIGRVPELVIEVLGRETAERDTAPRGAKFRAYELSGVQEYYYTWPDGREASGFQLVDGRYVAIPSDAEGFFTSPLLGARLRLVPAELRG